MNKGRKINVFKLVTSNLILIIIICCIIYWNNITINLYKLENYKLEEYSGNPIDLNSGLINNAYWGISSNDTNAIETRQGINNAIQYASDNNIENLKLEKGIYLVDTSTIGGSQRSIILKSNINLDLNGSTIKIKPNSNTNYGIISVFNENNISISNGIIIGDRYEHDYDTISSTHEWGRGIDIRGSTNIIVSNLEIYDMTGDGIYISEFGKKISQNINISNCNIYNTRRQGISVIAAQYVNIYNNEIHNINGTAPQSGIDLEKNKNEQIIKNINIFANKFYNCASNRGIHIYSYVENVYIDKNEIYGNININSNNNSGNDTIVIGNNTFLVKKNNDYSSLNTDLTSTFTDANLRKAILELVGKGENDKILESDIASIASDNVPGGKQLNLANKGITKLDGIEVFAKYNIEWLYLDNNNIIDLTPISSFTSLIKLNASNNNISDISVLKNLTNLKTINLTSNKVTDLSSLSDLNSIEYLYLNNNNIKSLDALSGKNTIKEIYCYENELESIENIVNLSSLEKLDVGRNNIKSMLTKINSDSLKYLNLNNNNLIDISGLDENNIDNLNIKNQYINLGTGQVISSGYIQIGLPQIFSTIDNVYNVEVKDLSYYEFKENNSAIIIPASEFIQYGLDIVVSKDNNTYITYSMNIDYSISEEVESKFNVAEFTEEYILTGVDATNNTVKDFGDNANFGDNYTLTFYKNNNMLSSSDVITTGTIMRIYNSEKDFYQDYTIIIYGDTNGDGQITSLDALKIISNKLNNIDENIVYVEAGRVADKTRNQKLQPSSIDALAIVKDKLDIYKIKQ